MKSLAEVLLLSALAVAAAGAGTAAQEPAPGATPGTTLTLADAMRRAVERYPAVRASLERVDASAAGVTVARSAYLPRLDSLWQSSLGTTNNVFGQLLPQPVIPALTGPVLPGESSDGVYGSAAGVLLTWQALDFGERRAGVDGARAELAQARASAAATELEVQAAAAAAFLDVVAADRRVAAARADFDRRQVLAGVVGALAANELRPGAEASRAEAEHAAARTRLYQAEAGLAVARTTLARLLEMATGDVIVDSAGLLDRPPELGSDVAAAAHPLARAREASLAAAAARSRVVARTDLPRLEVKSSVFARGSGAEPDGRFDTGTGGLALDRDNWAVGVQVLFPNLFSFASLGARRAAAEAATREAAALRDEALLMVNAEREAAEAILAAARSVAANTPVQLRAARESEAQARARYEAALASIVEVAEAQSLLAEAEAQDVVARVDVWRALLRAAVARGDLEPFVAALGVAGGEP
jgi:outer membrane protein TolC